MLEIKIPLDPKGAPYVFHCKVSRTPSERLYQVASKDGCFLGKWEAGFEAAVLSFKDEVIKRWNNNV
ncbi:hypothetical protein VP275E431_P0023 [Vibrio phage 275E43-1]|nr:hypothetical protein VP275E431_P0023 [Vibrio phage 275E43-1]